MKCWNIPQNFLCVFPFYMKTQHLCAQTWLTINLHCVPVIGWVHLCSHFQPNALAKKRSLLTSIYTSGTCYQKVKRCLLLTLAQETLRCINACTSEAVEQVIPVSQEQFWLPSTMVFAALYIPTCTELGTYVSEISTFSNRNHPYTNKDAAILWWRSKALVAAAPKEVATSVSIFNSCQALNTQRVSALWQQACASKSLRSNNIRRNAGSDLGANGKLFCQCT